MGKITPHLWFDTQAVEAAQFYAATFPNSKVTNVYTLRDTPSGDCDVVSFEVAGAPFMAISAGPLFTFNPSVSFVVSCGTAQDVDRLWATLSEGGKPLMELGAYPFSERYGWTEDRYGLSWQVMHNPEQETEATITPMLLFVGAVCGKAEEAIRWYTSLFADSTVVAVDRYGAGEAPDAEGTIRHARFTLAGQELTAMDSAHEHAFQFNEAISLMVSCDSQDEIDHYWQLSAVPESEQCGWLKDKYGVSWQVVPSNLEKLLQTGTNEQVARVTEAFLGMKKFDVAALQRAYEGQP